MVKRALAPVMIMTMIAMLSMASQPSTAQAQAGTPIVSVAELEVSSVTVVDGELVALLDVVLDVAGRTITRTIEVPISIDDATCEILALSLGPIDLDVLGLIVELDNCADVPGPITIDITAAPEEGPLGGLLCSVAGTLDEDGLLGLTDVQLDGIATVLNGVLADLLGAAGAVDMQSHTSDSHGQNHQCDILNLEIPEGLSLSLLGLNVDTSGICLHVYAERGSGNLLGNLLCSITNLLDNRGNNGNAQQALLRNVARLIDRLGL